MLLPRFVWGSLQHPSTVPACRCTGWQFGSMPNNRIIVLTKQCDAAFLNCHKVATRQCSQIAQEKHDGKRREKT
jgi:hypothetical protein